MKYSVKLMREKDGIKEVKNETVKAASAAEAYCAALRLTSHSEGWFPVGFTILEENTGK